MESAYVDSTIVDQKKSLGLAGGWGSVLNMYRALFLSQTMQCDNYSFCIYFVPGIISNLELI